MTDELRDKARALGLDRLTDQHLEQFSAGNRGMERHLQRLPRNMPPAQEPAHIYRAKEIAMSDEPRLSRPRRSRRADPRQEIVAGRVCDGAAGPDRAPRPQAQRLHRVDAGTSTGRGARGRGRDHGRSLARAVPRHALCAEGHHRRRRDLRRRRIRGSWQTTAPARMPWSPSGSKPPAGCLLGKLSTHEFAIGGPSFDLPWPPARNPWNRDHFCGGSSSGSGAGLAAGFFPAALGTDTGGSIRNPASMCGITGMKPTYGRVSRRGVVPLAFSLDHIGPMTRTVRDNALMLQVIAGHDPADPASADEPVPDYGAMLGQDVKGLRIGVIRHFYTTDVAGDPEQVDALDAAVRLFAEAGATTHEITLPPLQDFSACGQIILAAEAYAVHEQWLKRTAAGLRRAGARAAPRRRRARARSTTFRQCAGASSSATRSAAAFANIDVAITASSMDPACRIDDDAALAANYWRQARMPFNVTGQPGLVIPAGFSKDGLPLSLQLVGRPLASRCSTESLNSTRRPPAGPSVIRLGC